MEMKNRKLIEKIINVFLNILLVVFGIILLISIYIGIQSKLLKNEYTNFFGYTVFEVQTGSMKDAINVGDWVVVKLTKDVGLNDIVTYKLNDDFITHRIIEVYNNRYVTKGDSNNAKDEPIELDQVVGKVVKTLSSLGFLKKTLFNPVVLISIFITLLLFDFAFKKDNKKWFNKKDKDKDKIVKNFKDINGKDLENTLFYKIMPEDVKIEDVNIKESEEVIEENIVNEEYQEDDLDKTAMYRVIPVNADEISETLLEINENKEEEEVVEEKVVEDIVEEETEETLTNLNLEILEILKGKKNKHGDNVLSTFIYLKKEELHEIFDALFDLENLRTSENNIRNNFIDAYIDVKYYNCNDYEYSKNGYKNSITRIEKVIKPLYQSLNLTYKGKNGRYREFLGYYYKAILLVAKLEKIKETVTELPIKRDEYKKELLSNSKIINIDNAEYIINQTLKIQRKYALAFDYFLNKINTKTFELELNKVSSNRNVFGTNLNHSVNFSKVYSDYIIDKTYSEGVVAEDKTLILLNLLSIQLIKDIISYIFHNKYVFYIPDSLYSKEKKFEKTLKIFDNKYAKDQIIILMNMKNLAKYKVLIMKLKKLGYNFAVAFDEKSEFDSRRKGHLYLMKYIFVSKKNFSEEDIKNFIPEDLQSMVIHENIKEKVIDFLG